MKPWPIGPIVPMQHATPFSAFSPETWRDALAAVAAAGCNGVELAIADPTLLDSRAVTEALRTEGLRLLSITTGQAASLEGLSLVSEDEVIRRRSIRRIQDHMDLAAEHRALVIVGSLRGVDGKVDRLIESLRACAEHRPETRLALEPLNRYESRLVNTVSDALSVIDRVGSDNLGILFDTFHANIEEPTIDEAIRRAGERLVHVHLADSNRWVPGHGHIDFDSVWQALADAEYRGALVLEPFPLPTREALLAAGRRLVETMPT